MRHLYALALAALVAGCSSSPRTLISPRGSTIACRDCPATPVASPLPAVAIAPGDTWYIVPAGTGMVAYDSAEGASSMQPLRSESRYQIVARAGVRWLARTSTGRTFYLGPYSRPVRYVPTGGDIARHDRLDHERTTCATTTDPQAALAAGHTELDADGDGYACEDGHGTPARASAPATPPASSPSYTPSGGSGRVQVRGYTRRDGTYVAPHSRSRPRGH